MNTRIKDVSQKILKKFGKNFLMEVEYFMRLHNIKKSDFFKEDASIDGKKKKQYFDLRKNLKRTVDLESEKSEKEDDDEEQKTPVKTP